jgi:undecaprenyl-diphosphatase
MSIPIMIAAGGVGVKDMLSIPNLACFLPVMIIGIITAAIVGFLSIKWLLGYIRKHSFFGFAYYCIGICLLTFIVFMFRG